MYYYVFKVAQSFTDLKSQCRNTLLSAQNDDDGEEDDDDDEEDQSGSSSSSSEDSSDSDSDWTPRPPSHERGGAVQDTPPL